MLAVRLHAAGEPLRLEEVPIPAPVGTQIRLRVAACGVCRTDLHIADGLQQRVELPVTLGHEVAGWVDALGADASTELLTGEPVLLHGGWGCGACRDCVGGDEQRCANGRSPGFQADGGYAEYMLVPHPRHLVPLGSLDPFTAAPLADAGVTPFRAVRRAHPWLTPGARALVIGAGGLGQFAIQYLRRLPNLSIAVIEPHDRRRERAFGLGADDATDGPYDVVFDFVGTDASLALATRRIAPGGLVSLAGEGGGRATFSFDDLAVESWMTTTAWGSLDDLREVVTLAAAGDLSWDVEALPLSEAQTAHDRLRRGDVAHRLVLVPAPELHPLNVSGKSSGF